MTIRIRIRKHEYGLWFEHGDFKRLLEPGAYFMTPGLFFGRSQVKTVNTLMTKFVHPMLDVLIKNDSLGERLQVIDLIDNQRAFVWRDGRLAYILGPGRHAFWKQPYAIEHEVFEVDGADARFDHKRIDAVLTHADASQHFRVLHVEAHERVLLFQEGQLIEAVGPGRYVFWKQTAEITWKTVDLREQGADVAGQEIMTADKMSLRVNLLVTWQVSDPVKAVTVVDYAQSLYREAQLALRAAVGGRQLDKLLADKEAVGNEVRGAITKRVAEFGVIVKSVGLRDIILPGDMKTILNKVIEAQKQAEANLIRRREETAAARSQANTARLLAENPVLARMKELEAIQEILAGTKATFFLGQGDLVNQVKNLAVRDTVEDA